MYDNNECLLQDSNCPLSNILKKIDAIRMHHSGHVVLSMLHLSNVHVIADSMGVEFLHIIKNILINDIRSSLENVIIMGFISEQKLILLHIPSSQDKLKEDLATIFINLRKHEIIAATHTAMSYKCGSVVMEKGMSIDSCYAKACMAFNETFSQDSYKHFFADEIVDKISDFSTRMQLASYFQDAIHSNRLKLAFQPIVSAKTGEIISYECLLRLLTCEGEIISAGPFIAIAEKMGFMDEVDNIVLDLVIAELEKFPTVCLGVNISTVSIDNKRWLSKAEKFLQDPASSSRLMIEITETSAYRDLDKLGHFVNFIQGLGSKIAIDDFGAGYTSFKQLQRLRADVIKIDGMFIRDVAINYDNRFFVQMMLDCSKAFNMKTVAEFVETPEISDILKELDIDYMQGNYFGEAVNYRPWLKEESDKNKEASLTLI